MRITVPAADWTTHLPDAIENAPRGATILVATPAMKELGKRAAGRMGRGDLTFEVEPDGS